MDRKLELKRLLIYLAVTFGISWAWFLGITAKGYLWDTESAMSSVIGFGMLVPFSANLITRWITKEGFAMTGKDSLMLGISFQDKKWIFFLMALFIPWIYDELAEVFTIVVFPQAFDPMYYQKMEMDKDIVFIFPLVAIVQATVVSFGALGEEGGWRGYMMPKLMKLLGYKKAILIGGVIWGVWHAPITCIGHNFGTDYPGFPYLGILTMCIFCTLMGVILTFVTVKSGSIWPAAIMHAVNNATPSILNFFVNKDIVNELLPNKILSWVFLLIPVAIVAGICFVFMRGSRVDILCPEN